MTSDPRWVSAALEDLESGFQWYEARESGLGRELAEAADEAINRAARHPFLLREYEHPNLPADAEVRKMQLNRFNEYGLIYAIIADTFWIVALAHDKRKPGYWLDRLKKLP